MYEGQCPAVALSRAEFWLSCGWAECARQFSARAVILGPRRNIRSARDEAIDTTLERDATHLLFMDDDILVPRTVLPALLAQRKPIIGGLVHKDNGDPLVWVDAGDGEIPYYSHPRQGAFECAAVAAGVMLIEVGVLKKLRPLRRWLFNYDETGRTMDVRFCRMARGAGFSVWCWPDVLCQQVQH